MARTEKVIMTNMCMVFSENRVLVQDKRDDDYSGITFPGGHVERGESFTDAVIREVWEETGLKISEPKLCGIKDWMKDEETRYIVLLYKTDKFEGIVTSFEEGDCLYGGDCSEGAGVCVIWGSLEAAIFAILYIVKSTIKYFL